MHSLNSLAFRNLSQHWLRTALSALAVALGVAMIVAADVIGKAIGYAGEQLENAQSTAGILGAQLEAWLGTIGIIILAVAGFLLFNAFAMSVTQRQRQIGMLRSLGLTRLQVMRLVSVEALLTGAMGTLLGLIGGPLLGSGTIILLDKWASIQVSHTFQDGLPSTGTISISAALGMGMTLLSIVFPARRAMRISPLAALRPQADETRS